MDDWKEKEVDEWVKELFSKKQSAKILELVDTLHNLEFEVVFDFINLTETDWDKLGFAIGH